MKKTLLFIAATLFVACSGNNQKKNASDTPEDINALIPELVKHIPDGEIPADAEEYFTPEYYSLLKQAWSVPEPEEGIGDEEFLNYFIEGNGDCPGNHECKNFKTQINGEEAVSTFDYSHGIDTEYREIVDSHTIKLKKTSKGWLIDDWDNTKQEMKDFVTNSANE